MHADSPYACGQQHNVGEAALNFNPPPKTKISIMHRLSGRKWMDSSTSLIEVAEKRHNPKQEVAACEEFPAGDDLLLNEFTPPPLCMAY
jgi:hypothetical protein